MASHLHPSNCVGVRNFAELHGHTELVSRADRFMLDNFATVAASDEFHEMTANNLTALIASSFLNVRSEVCCCDSEDDVCCVCVCVCVAYTSATTKVLFCGRRLSAADPVYMILWISVICGVSHTFTSSTCIHTVPTRWSFLVIRVFTSFVFSCRHRIKQSV